MVNFLSRSLSYCSIRLIVAFTTIREDFVAFAAVVISLSLLLVPSTLEPPTFLAEYLHSGLLVSRLLITH